MTHKRIQELDALRLFAASSVVLYHLTYRTGFPSIDWVTQYGYLGVELFFMISGFVILWSANGRTVGQFAVSRLARLYPLFWIAIGLTSIIVPVTFPQVLANATMMAGYLGQDYIDGVYWTLQVELKFYILVGALLLFKQQGRLELWLAAWLLASVAAEFAPQLRTVVIYPYSPLFIGGASCYLIRSHGISWLRLAMLGVSMLMAVTYSERTAEGFITDHHGFVPQIATIGMFSILLLVALKRLPIHCPLWAAAITYPLYLVHNMIGRWTMRLIGGDWIALVITLAFVTALAYLLARLDKPLGDWVKAAVRVRTQIERAK